MRGIGNWVRVGGAKKDIAARRKEGKKEHCCIIDCSQSCQKTDLIILYTIAFGLPVHTYQVGTCYVQARCTNTRCADKQ
jgi:hypothetical protein